MLFLAVPVETGGGFWTEKMHFRCGTRWKDSCPERLRNQVVFSSSVQLAGGTIGATEGA